MTIADLLVRQGDVAAQGYRQGGQIASNLAGQLGAVPGQYVAAVRQNKQQQMSDLLTGQQIDSGAALEDERKTTTAARKADVVRADKLRALFASGQPVTLPAVASIVGPKDATDILKGIQAYQDDEGKIYDSAQRRIGAAMGGVLATPAPARAQAYADLVKGLTEKGIVKPGELPAQYDEAFVTRAHVGAMTPDAQQGVIVPKLTERDPTKDLVNAQGDVVTRGAPKPMTPQRPVQIMRNGVAVWTAPADALGQQAPPTAAGTAAAAMSGPAVTVDASRPDPATANKTDPKLGYTPNAIYQNAITFALSGALPAGARNAASVPGQKAIQNKAAALADAAGVTQADLKREYNGATSATRSMMGRYQFSAASAQAANDNLALAQTLAKDVPRSNTPIVNRYSQWSTSELGGKKLPNLSAFETAVYTAVREYAKVTSGSAGSVGGITDSATKQADHLLNAAQTEGQFDAVSDVMRKDMANFIKPMKSEIEKSNDLGPSLKRFMDFLGRDVVSNEAAKDSMGIR